MQFIPQSSHQEDYLAELDLVDYAHPAVQAVIGQVAAPSDAQKPSASDALMSLCATTFTIPQTSRVRSSRAAPYGSIPTDWNSANIFCQTASRLHLYPTEQQYRVSCAPLIFIVFPLDNICSLSYNTKAYEYINFSLDRSNA